MSFYKEVPGRQTTLESTLKFDTTPTAGSTNPVTSGGVANAVTDVLDDHATVTQDEELTMPTAEAANYTVGNYFEQDGEIWKVTAKTDNGDGTWTVEAEKMNGVVPALNALINDGDTLSDMTLRFMFSDATYSPQAEGVGAAGTWKKKLDTNYNVWDWTNNNASWSNQFEGAFIDPNNIVEIIDAGNTSNLTSLYYCFRNCTSLNSICLFNTSNVLNISQAFTKTAIKVLPKFDFGKVVNCIATCLQCAGLKTVNDLSLASVAGLSGLQQFFDGCTNLENVGTIYAPNVRQVHYMFRGCSSLKSIPSINCENVTNTMDMFNGCRNIESGILDFYNYLSTKDVAVTNYSGTFNNCGIDTVTGSAELAQIPSSWGGTGT